MQSPGHHFLAGAAFSLNEYGAIKGGNLAYEVEYFKHGFAVADHLRRPILGEELLSERIFLSHQQNLVKGSPHQQF